MLSFIKALGVGFQPAGLIEVTGSLDQPGRGWYRIYTYRLEEEAWEEPVRYPGESLALTLFNIGACKDEDLGREVLDRIDQMLQHFEMLGFDLILRICYDTEGKGMVREPSLFSQVKKHIAQLAPILKKHANHIYVYQGLLVGSWGEMHESKFLLPQYLKELMETFLRETDGKVKLSVRKPVQYRIAFSEGQERRQIGFFNDGMLGSGTHLGTFAPETAGRGNWKEPWSQEEEIRFMAPLIDEVPYGGEVLMTPMPLAPENILETLRSLRVSYLNSTHDAALLSEWKRTSFEGMPFFTYVGEHLGYRFLVRSVQGKWGKNMELTVTIENSGFGSCYEDVDTVILGRTDEYAALVTLGTLNGNLKDLHGGKTGSYSGTFRTESLTLRDKGARLQILALLRRKRDGRTIHFAQQETECGLLLGYFTK